MWLIIAIIVIALIWLYVMNLYNKLVVLRNNRENAFADIDVQLKLRFDLVPNLVNTVKWYAEQEKAIFDKITQARSTYSGAKSIDDKIAASNMLSWALSGILAIAESNPEIKSNQNFMSLQAELSDIENKIAAARRFFNSATKEYNSSIQMFPANVIAGNFGFSKAEFFEIDNQQEKEAVKVEF